MKKIYLLLGICLFSICGATSVSAQTSSENADTIPGMTKYEKDRYVTNEFWDNWSVVLGGGAQFYYGDNDKYMKFGDKITPAIDLYINKWVTPNFGFGLGLSGLRFKGLYLPSNTHASWPTGEFYKHESNGKDYYMQKGYFGNAFFYFVLDMDNIIAGYNPKRFYNCALYAGGGVDWGFDHKLQGYDHFAPTFNLGFVNKFRLTEKWSLILNLRGALVGDSFDGESRESEPDADHIKKNIPVDGLFGVTAGICYRFGGHRKQLFDNAANEEYYNNVIDSKERIVSNLNENLSASKEREKELTAQVAQLQSAAPVVEKQQLNLRWHINFDLDKWDLSNRELLDLEIISDVMKQDTSIPYYLFGYADVQTGSTNRNWKLSQERVNIVYKTLTETYGVNPEQLKTQYDGGVDIMFMEDNKLTRCVMIYSGKALNSK